MFIVRPDVEEADLDKLIEGFQKNVTDGGGEVKSVEKMGRAGLHGAQVQRRLLRPVERRGPRAALIAEIERRLRVSEQVIKFITVRIDEEEKRLAKVKAIRDTKVKRSAQPTAPAQRHLVPKPALLRSTKRRSQLQRLPVGMRLRRLLLAV